MPGRGHACPRLTRHVVQGPATAAHNHAPQPSILVPLPHPPAAIDNCLREPISRNQCSTIRGELE